MTWFFAPIVWLFFRSTGSLISQQRAFRMDGNVIGRSPNAHQNQILMAHIAVLAHPEILGDIFVAVGNRLPSARIIRFRSSRELIQGITNGDFDASIIANPDMPVANIISELRAKDERLFVVVLNGQNAAVDDARVRVMKLDSSTADEVVNLVVRSCSGT